MDRYKILMLLGGAFVLFFVSLGGCQHVPKAFKGTSPQYIGLGEFENPSQGLSFTVIRKEPPNPNVPVIKHAYAIDRGIYGTILKIYIEAENPNGEMAKIATTVDQVGYGHYPTDFIILKPEYRKYFKGYIQWNTFSTHIFRMGEFVRQFVTVAVMDKTGNSSNEFVFPFTFDTGVEPAPNPPAPFDQGGLPKLGNVFIDLFDPFQMGAGSQNDKN